MKPERFGLVMPEALACGTPVIAFDKGSVKEIVNNKTGFVVSNVEEAISCINNIDKINRKACRKHVEEHFTVEKMVENYEKVYNKILSLQNKE